MTMTTPKKEQGEEALRAGGPGSLGPGEDGADPGGDHQRDQHGAGEHSMQ